ncbi:MAG TPA: IS66 family transposase [Blastocatellia bacterium]|nr:IS66 family transposase [Blastocatellia bacterium]
MKNNDDIPTTDTTEIKQLINRVKQGELDQGDALLIEKLLNFLLTIVSLLQRKHTSIQRMKELLFGMKMKKQGKDEAKNRAEESRSGAEENSQADSPKETASNSTCESDSSPQEVTRPKRPGHGRKAASDYPGARLVRLNHLEMAPGDPCPESDCEGNLHQLEQPNVKIYLMGQPLISATKYERPVLRCSDCFKRFAADLPEGVKEDEKFDETADVAIALNKYSGGIPFYRQARMQESYGVPLPESVQFERCEEVANAVFPVYRHLVELSADGKLFHIDDTRVRILSCYREDKHRSEKERRATHTSGIVVKDMASRKIALYFSSRRHAGENLDNVLERRSPSLPMPIKMSDAAAVNGKKRAQTIDANCLAHGRGKFKELEEIFHIECRQVMEAIRKVYWYDDQTKGLSDQERLEYHQKHSGPVMEELREWIEGEFRDRRVEPNSSLGKAFQYLLNHFEKLTRFLSAPGTPIDNNAAERVLKRFVLFRKSSLFYKGERQSPSHIGQSRRFDDDLRRRLVH